MDRTFTTRQRRELAGRARTLHERLDGPPNDPGGKSPFDPEEVLAAWRERFPDDESFRNRLARDGITEAAVRNQVAATRWPGGTPLPDWIDGIEAVVRYVERGADDGPPDVSVPDETAFVELLATVAGYAHERLPGEAFGRDSLAPMTEWLVKRLETVCVQPLYVEFKSFVEYHDPDLAAADPDEFADPPTTYYERFVDAVFDGGFREVCLEYPVLARTLVRLLDQWIDAVAELSRRLRTDRAALEREFDVDGAVTALEPLAEDAHARGRVPVRVSFVSGSVVYKPRPVDAAVAFHEILDRLAERGPVPSFRRPAVLPCGGYGWMAFVEYCDPADADAVDRYYERAGALLCIAYVLNLEDCQFENLVVAGDSPVLVDAETTLHPHLAPGAIPTDTALSAVVDRSVLFTSLLPWTAGDPRDHDEAGLTVSAAGLGDDSAGKRASTQSRPSVVAVNTDVMSVESSEPRIDLRTNTPTVDGEDRPPAEHVGAIVRGFERTYGTIQRLHEEGRFRSTVLDPESIGGVENRMVYRASVEYASVLRSATARDPLRDGVRWTVETEALAVPFFDGRIESDRYWPLYEAERRALRRFDVPRFGSTVDGTAVVHDGSVLGVTTDGSGYDRCRRRLDAMDDRDRRRGTWTIRQCLGATESRPTAPPPVEVAEDRLRRTAVELFEEAMDAAFETDAGGVWASLGRFGSTMTLIPAGPSLYHGRGGMALAGAALHVATGERRYRELVDELLGPVIDGLATDGPPSGAGMTPTGLGGTRGVGSVAYVLSVLGELLDEARYRDRALEAAGLVTDERLAADDAFDVMEGAAGTVLALLACHDRFGESTVLDRAVACGDRLLDERTPVDGYRVWKTIEDVPITGFAHGSSGIAYALARLANATGERRYADAVREALAFEESLYSPDRTNWAGSARKTQYRDMWCHGRTGIALARIGIGEYLDDDELLADARDALAATASAEPASVDHVCCGNFGRVEAMLVGARKAGGDVADATALAGRCLARRERDGTLSLAGHSRSFVNPTFFDGLSGAAYTLVRLRRPDALPSVLLLE